MRRFSRPFLELKRRLPPLADIRHVRIHDIIREAPFFVAQTRSIFRADDVPAEFVARARPNQFDAALSDGRRLPARRAARLSSAHRPFITQLFRDARSAWRTTVAALSRCSTAGKRW